MVTGLVLVTVPTAVWLSGAGAPAPDGPPPETVAASASEIPAPTVAPDSPTPTPAPTRTAPPDASVESERVATGAAPTDGPARITLAGLDIDVPVVPVGVDGKGQMEVPIDVRTVGWYRFGPEPGSDAGSSVLSGHVDDRVQGRGAFYRLTDLDEGDPVQVTGGDGRVLDYVVTSVERIDKSELPVDRLFARDGRPRLTLVTCGGEFDRETRNYRDNVVVTAEPVA